MEKDKLKDDLMKARQDLLMMGNNDLMLQKELEDTQNIANSQLKELDIWKQKYKNLKKEINGLKSQFEQYKTQVLKDL